MAQTKGKNYERLDDYPHIVSTIHMQLEHLFRGNYKC